MGESSRKENRLAFYAAQYQESFTPYTFSSAFALELDGQGRIILPPVIRQYAEIRDEVVVVGAYTHIEIWSKKLWAAEKDYMSEHASEIAEAVDA